MLVGVVVACALGGATTSVAAAAALPVPCWQRLISDWSDGRIDGRYPASCYRSAIANAPADLAIYSTLDDDLQAALRIRIATPAPDHAGRRTLALERPALTAGSSSSTQTRLVTLFAVLGGALVAAWFAAVLARRRRVQLAREQER